MLYPDIGRHIFTILSVALCLIGSEGAAPNRLRCERPGSIANGSFRLKRNFMRAFCNPGYQLQGLKTIGCVHGKWDGDKPVCAKKGCPKNLDAPTNGRLQIESDLKTILYCLDNYSLAGNRYSYCNGTHWDRPIGSCRERSGKVSHECDFETDDVCGWSYEPMANLEWKRVMAANVFTSFKTGPRHDHTTMTHNGGHYMLMESLIRQDMPVTLTSPIYDQELSLKSACFQFYYFMYGAGVGDLLVVVKPVSVSLDDILLSPEDESSLIKFERNGNQNNIWNEAHFTIDEMEEDFQIVFVAKSGRNHLSDIAVDDVRLIIGDECQALNKNPEDSNEEYEATTYQSLYEMQSCVGRCFDASGVGMVREAGLLTGLCSCSAECEEADTCCPDFKSVCLTELFQSSTVESATKEEKFESTTNTTLSTTTKLTSTTSEATTPSTTTPTTPKSVTTTRKTTPTTTKATTPITSTKLTSTTENTTPSTTTVKTTITTPTTTTIRTTPSTTTIRTTTSRKPLPPTRTTVRTTKATTPEKPTSTTTTTTTTKRPTTQKTTTSVKPTTLTERTVSTKPTQKSIVETPTQKSPTKPKSTSYVIDSDPKAESAHRGSRLLLWTLIIVVVVIVVLIGYRRFGDRAVAWYMIHFSKRGNGDEETSYITTSLKRPSTGRENVEKAKKTKPLKKPSSYSNDFTRPLVEDDVDDEESSPVNGSIALKHNIYTEL